MSNFLQNAHIIGGLYPKADAFASTGETDRISVENYGKIGFLIATGARTGSTAAAVVTVAAHVAASSGTPTAIPFDYRVCLSSTSVDAWSVTTRAAAAGFTMTTGDNYMYWVEVDAELVESNDAGSKFVSCVCTEAADDPIIAGIIAFGLDPRYPQDIPLTAIA